MIHNFRLFLFILVIHTTILCSSACTKSNQPIFHRIISLYPAHTENLTALGIENKLIGIASSDTYPPSILNKPRFSHHDNAEKFIAVNPDLVLIRPMIEHSAPQLLAQLRSAGITVISLQPRNLKEMFQYWKELGKLTGKDKAAEQMVAHFNNEISHKQLALQNIPDEKRPRVYFESIHSRMKTFSPSSIAAFVLEQAGGRNIATDALARRDTNIAAYGKEHILAHADEIDIFLAQQGRMNHVTREIISQESGFQAIRAVRDGRIFLVNEQLVSRPTERILQGIDEIRRFLYPTP